MTFIRKIKNVGKEMNFSSGRSVSPSSVMVRKVLRSLGLDVDQWISVKHRINILIPKGASAVAYLHFQGALFKL